MRRRTFIASLGAAAAAWPFASRADEGIPRVGYLGLAPADPEKPLFAAFEAGLSELGYVPGKTIEIEFRTADGLGAKPGDTPIEQATKFVTIVNLKTAILA